MSAKPDVVLIFMDDMTHWSLRSDAVRTPNLDRLRERGVTFTHAFNQGSTEPAVCVPARRMLLTGLTLYESEPRFAEVTRLGQALGGAGYETFFTGKWHNPPEALDEDYGEVGPWGAGMFGSVNAEDDAYRRPREGDTWDPADTSRGGHWLTLADGSVQHSSERWTDAAVDFLRRASVDRPYFLHLAYHAPHDPKQAPQEFLDLYPAAEISVPPNALPEHPFDNGALEIRDEMLAPHPRTPDAVRLHRREYFAMLTHVDREIGRVLDAVDQREARLGRPTVIVFSGDHGLALGEHGLMGKQSLYDHSTRVPLVIVGPGVPAGERRERPVYAGGIYATICDVIGLRPPAHLRFDSLAPAVGGEEQDGEIFTAYGPDQRSIRVGRVKLITYADTSNDQLFDVVADPWETRNLIDDPARAEAVDDLRTRLDRARRRFGDPWLDRVDPGRAAKATD
ncbi:sulfatase-like hydrolase/transferase [Microbacterium sp. SSW1-59]|uniref:sulfatase-like hydrolase/transferase n=1 Tax=Microbacterium xanthum TaxID=3079794 RepID=UPI002AD2A180|nr:sulfatase-like hydrolase/transferase [Microbacterium sp. SSW1-59]MDZ8200365.1 sulfatase-like hydrolase/transferase [Microbacterium sp. SSW1-59]